MVSFAYILSLNMTPVYTCAVACQGGLFFFIAKEHSVICIYSISFIFSADGGHLCWL